MKRPDKGLPAGPPRQGKGPCQAGASQTEVLGRGRPRQGPLGPPRQGPSRQGLPNRSKGPLPGRASQTAAQGPPRAGLPGRGLPGRGLPGPQAKAGCPIRGKLLGCLPGQALGSSAPRKTTTAGGGAPLGGALRDLTKGGCCVLPEGLGYLILGRPDGFLASDLPGPPRSPQLPAGLELRRPPEGFWLRSYLACRLRCVRPARLLFGFPCLRRRNSRGSPGFMFWLLEK